MTEIGLFILGGPETQLHDILWAVHDKKTVVEARARKISESSRVRWVVGAERCTEVSAFLSCTRVCARRWLTEPWESIVVLLISKSVEPNEEQKEMISGFQQDILCKH